MTIWFTADHHFQHENIIKFCNRPFQDVDEMNAVLVKKWNSIVKHDDVVYHLGDFTLHNGVIAKQFFASLNGAIRILPGSHDSRWIVSPDIYSPYDSLDDVVEILPPLVSLELPELGDDKYPQVIVLCHYALREWDRSHYGAWHLYGHSHGKLAGQGKSFDVGVDCTNFAPISLDEVAEMMRKR